MMSRVPSRFQTLQVAGLQDAFERPWRQGRGQAPKQKWWYSASLRLRGLAYILALGFFADGVAGDIHLFSAAVELGGQLRAG